MGKIKSGKKTAHKQNDPLDRTKRTKKQKFKKRDKVKEDQGEDDDGNVNEAEETLTLDLVKELGGDEEDLKLLENIDKDANSDEINKETEADLKNLIKSLNFSKFSTDSFVIKEEEQEDRSKAKDEKKKVEKVQDNEISSSSDVKSEEPDEVKSESEDEEDNSTQSHSFSFLKDKVSNRSHCVVKPGEKWHSYCNEEAVDAKETNSYWLKKLEKYTKAVWDKEVENFKKSGMKGSRKSEWQWIQTVLKSGTLNDKFHAYVLLLQDSPVQNITALETLIDYVNLKSRRPCLMAIDNLQHLFLTVLLHPNRKLRNFEQNPFTALSEMSGGNRDTIDRYLITWMFEDKVKKLYVKFLDNLELVGKDSIDKTKIKSLSTILELLAGNPEQESVLLNRLVNKLGDPSRTIASKAMYLLSQLLDRHPVMKWVVVGEVERLLYRPNIAARAQYFGICFLSQIILEKFNQDK